MLVQVEATTINPSDLLSIEGAIYYKNAKLPIVGGKEGVGRVIKTGNNVKDFQGKRVCFAELFGGGWSNFVVLRTNYVFVID